MKQRTDRTFRSILRFIDLKLDELSAQDDDLGMESALDTDSTPTRRVRAKLDELALAIEFELQLNKVRAKRVPSGLSCAESEDFQAKRSADRITLGSGPTVAEEVQELSPFWQSVDRWFKDHPLDDDDSKGQ